MQDDFEMNKRKSYLKEHPYSIWQGKDGKWRTYLLKEGEYETKKENRKLIKRNTEKEIEDIVVEYYKKLSEEKDTKVTFEKMYYRWRKYQDCLVSDNTVKKYNTDY